MTIRDTVKEIQAELTRASELVPSRAEELMLMLSAMLGSIGDEIRMRRMAYSQVLLEARKKEKSAADAKLVAETSVEYQMKMEAEHVKDSAIEMLRALKIFIKNQKEDFVSTHH